MIRRIAKLLPVVYNILDKKPLNEGWYWCKYYSWDICVNDYKSMADIFFFDGENFRTEHLCDYDAADWIYELIDIVGGKKYKEFE